MPAMQGRLVGFRRCDGNVSLRARGRRIHRAGQTGPVDHAAQESRRLGFIQELVHHLESGRIALGYGNRLFDREEVILP